MGITVENIQFLRLNSAVLQRETYRPALDIPLALLTMETQASYNTTPSKESLGTPGDVSLQSGGEPQQT
jgi:hypothetical protein